MRPSTGIGLLSCGSALAFAGMVAGSGCTVLTNDALPDDAGKFDGTTDGSTPVCASCLAQECAGQWASCLTDPGCIAVAKRASGSACESPDGSTADGGLDPVNVYGAFAACNEAKAGSGSCGSDCAGVSLPAACFAGDAGTDSGPSEAGDAGDAGDASDDGATSDAGDAGDDAAIADASTDAATDGGPTPATPSVESCTSCVSSKCGDPKKSCGIGSECATYLECTFAATDVAAAEECGRQHATGKSAAGELATCTRVGCNDACGF